MSFVFENLHIQQQREQQQSERQQQHLSTAAKIQSVEDEYTDWTARQYASFIMPVLHILLYILYSFMNDDRCPQCILRVAPSNRSMPIKITFLEVLETENLLDHQEELISAPLKVKFDSTVSIDRCFFQK